MTVEHVWCGATTHSSVWVRARVQGSAARLAVDTDAAFPSPMFFGPASPTGDSMVSIAASGLTPGTRHHYTIEVDGTLETAAAGQFVTHPEPGQPASFTIGAGSCAGQSGQFVEDRNSNAPIFDTIRTRAIAEGWLFFLHMGDMHYWDIGGPGSLEPDPTLAAYRRSYDAVLSFNGQGLSARQGQLWRNLPIVYQWDDHDYGPNNSDRTHPGRDNAQTAYRERVPHYPLAEDDAGGGIYHTFQVGRILFMVSDHRSYRDPNSAADGPNKTMLGSAQKTWMRDVLSTTDARVLVWANEQYQSSVDSWQSFQTEQAELRDMLDELGWLDRMLILSGDIHHLAMDTGGGQTNPWGVPTYLFSAIDADPGNGGQPIEGFFDTGPSSPGRNRYGTLQVDDNGDQITVTGIGWIGTQEWRRHSFTVTTVEDPGPAPPPPVARATIRTQVTWLGCDLVTGGIIAELPDLSGSVERVIGEATSSQIRAPVPTGGTGRLPVELVKQATQPGRTMVVAVVNDLPAWAGIVMRRDRGSDATISLACASPEAYLDRRFVGDHTFTGVDEATIAAGLVRDAQVEGIRLEVDAPETGTTRDRSYFAKDDATVLDRMQELSDVEGGPEWTIDLDWTDDTHRAVRKVFRLRQRLGRVTGGAIFETTAASVFSSAGASEAVYTLAEDYTDGKGANHVVATAPGQGEDRPQSIAVRAEDLIAGGWPRYERRFQPSTSITDPQTLFLHAQRELRRRRRGARVWSLDVRWDAAPRYGVDWILGDLVAWNVIGHGDPDGISGQGRIIGWTMEMPAGRMTPKLLQED